MGLRSSAQSCQRITTAVCKMYFQMGFSAVNYLDDFGRAVLTVSKVTPRKVILLVGSTLFFFDSSRPHELSNSPRHSYAFCARVFVNRLLSWLRAAFPENSTGIHRVFRNIPNYVLKDLRWWERYLSTFNGISMMSIENWSAPDEMLSCETNFLLTS
jgi:hypothetical protein